MIKWEKDNRISKEIDPDVLHGTEIKKFSWFERLKKKWKVNGTQLVLILCVFAITGTTTAYITRMITTWMELRSNQPIYWIMKLVILIFGYQVLILLFSIPFGQFPFFWNYEKKILKWFSFRKKNRVPLKKNPAP